MRSKRKPQPVPAPVPVEAEAEPAPAPVAAPAAEEAPRPSPWWKLLGGLAAALGLAVVVGVYHLLQAQLAGLRTEASALGKDLRGDLSRLNRDAVGFVKKEEVATRLRNVWDRLKELQAGRTDLASLRERCALLADLYKAGEQERKGLGEQVRALRQKGRAAQEKAELAKQVRRISERIAQLEGKPAAEAAGGAEQAEKR